MAFIKKTWKDRQSEYPNRRILVPTGNDGEYDVSRSEGLVVEEGDKLDAENINDLEERIEKAVQTAQTTAENAMPKGGGAFTGDVAAYNGNRATASLRNTEVRITGTDGELQSTNKIIMVRK